MRYLFERHETRRDDLSLINTHVLFYDSWVQIITHVLFYERGILLGNWFPWKT